MQIGRSGRKAQKLMDELERCSFCGARVEMYARSCPACAHDLVEEKIAVFCKQRAIGMMTGAAFEEIVRLLESGVDTADSSVSSPQIRKQVGDLTPSDLEQYPTWEFAIDEDGEEGQDEETVRPRPDVELADPAGGLFIVRAEFAAADGARFDGFVSLHEERHVAGAQPTIVSDTAHVPFWFGTVPPTPARLHASCRALNKTRQTSSHCATARSSSTPAQS